MAVVDIFLSVVKAVVFVYDLVSYPLYAIAQTPRSEKTKQKALGRVVMTSSDDAAAAFKRERGDSPIYEEIIVRNNVDTVTKAFDYAVKKYGSRECLGTRDVLGVQDELQKNGKVFQKLSLGDYKWMSYDQVCVRYITFLGLRK